MADAIVKILREALKEAIDLRVKLYRNGDLLGEDDDLSDAQIAQKESYARKWSAALDAAIEAQGLDDAFNAGVVSTFEQRAKDLEETYANARAEAFEEAAKACAPHDDDDPLDRQAKAECAAAIRALAKEPKK